MKGTSRRRWATTAALVATVSVLAACSSDSSDDAEDSGSPTAAESSASSGVLADVCPSTVVIQADWEPESEHGGIYQLLGDDYTVDTEKKSVSGPLMAGDEPTGVDVEIRIGGAPVGYQPVHSLLYQDDDILMGYGRVSEYMTAQAEAPVTAVMATLEKSPYSIYWDPETYPDATSIADLKKDNVKILMGSEATVWQDFLVATGVIDASQIDQSDAPKPASFIAANGAVAEAGFASAEPYLYEVESPEWGKPVKVGLIHDTGFPEYFQALVVRTEDVTAKADCFSALVPILQQAEIDYVKDPARTNALLVSLTEQYDTGWVYTAGMADWSIAQQTKLGLIGDGADGTFGSFDPDRVTTLIDIVGQYTDYDVSSITPDSLVTNEFLDPSISLG